MVLEYLLKRKKRWTAGEKFRPRWQHLYCSVPHGAAFFAFFNPVKRHYWSNPVEITHNWRRKHCNMRAFQKVFLLALIFKVQYKCKNWSFYCMVNRSIDWLITLSGFRRFVWLIDEVIDWLIDCLEYIFWTSCLLKKLNSNSYRDCGLSLRYSVP